MGQSSMTDEVIEIFDDNYNSIGTIGSAEAHKKGYWHRVFHCWLLEPVTRTILYQRRSPTKALYPGMLDVSVAGHCRYKEKIEEAAVREAWEELGLRLSIDLLHPLGIRRDAFVSDNLINREFQHIYLAPLTAPIRSLRLDEKEVAEVAFIAPQAVISILLHNHVATVSAWRPSGGEYETTVSHRDFTSSVDNYNLKIPLLVERYVEGKRHLII